jgi:hypothetical protein
MSYDVPKPQIPSAIFCKFDWRAWCALRILASHPDWLADND